MLAESNFMGSYHAAVNAFLCLMSNFVFIWLARHETVVDILLLDLFLNVGLHEVKETTFDFKFLAEMEKRHKILCWSKAHKTKRCGFHFCFISMLIYGSIDPASSKMNLNFFRRTQARIVGLCDR